MSSQNCLVGMLGQVLCCDGEFGNRVREAESSVGILFLLNQDSKQFVLILEHFAALINNHFSHELQMLTGCNEITMLLISFKQGL